MLIWQADWILILYWSLDNWILIQIETVMETWSSIDSVFHDEIIYWQILIKIMIGYWSGLIRTIILFVISWAMLSIDRLIENRSLEGRYWSSPNFTFSPVSHTCTVSGYPLGIRQRILDTVHALVTQLWQCPRSVQGCNNPKTWVVPSAVSSTGGDATLSHEYSVGQPAASLHLGTYAFLAASCSLAGLLSLRLC